MSPVIRVKIAEERLEQLEERAQRALTGSFYAQVSAPELAVLVSGYRDLVNLVREAAALHERVEMDESVGVCLTDRVPSLRLGRLLGELAW